MSTEKISCPVASLEWSENLREGLRLQSGAREPEATRACGDLGVCQPQKYSQRQSGLSELSCLDAKGLILYTLPGLSRRWMGATNNKKA